MAGYEDLTPEQLMFLSNIVLYCVTVIVIGWIVKAFIQLKTARYIHLRIEKEIVAQVENEIFEKKPFIVKIKEWIEKRKKEREEKLLR